MHNAKKSAIAVVVAVMAATQFIPVSFANAQTLDVADLECVARDITPCLSTAPSRTATPTAPQTTVPQLASAIESDCESLGELTELVLLADYRLAAGELADLVPDRVQPFSDAEVPELRVVESNPVRSFFISSSGAANTDSSRALCQIIVSKNWGSGTTYHNYLTCRNGNKFFTTGLFDPYSSYQPVDAIMCNLIASSQLPGFTVEMTYLEYFRAMTWLYRMLTVCGTANFGCWGNHGFWREQYQERQREIAEEAQLAAEEAERAAEATRRAAEEARRAAR